MASEEQIIKKAMSILGSRTSKRKTASCRRNARRPRKKLTVRNNRARNAKTTKIKVNKSLALANG